jgi:hypothetical protein
MNIKLSITKLLINILALSYAYYKHLYYFVKGLLLIYSQIVIFCVVKSRTFKPMAVNNEHSSQFAQRRNYRPR